MGVGMMLVSGRFCFVTANILATVRLLSPMNTTVSCQTRGVGKRLPAFRNFALMRLLAGVRSKMYSESTALDEPLSTVLPVASVWPFVCVDAVVSLKIGLSVEALAATLPITQKWTRPLWIFSHDLKEFHTKVKLPLRFGSLLLWSFVLLDGKIKAQSLRADDGRAP
jgi:hypothetical protein